MTGRRSEVIGTPKLRRVLQTIGKEANEQVRLELEDMAEALLAEMRATVPERSGKLKKLLRKSRRSNGLAWAVGLATKRARKKGFYAKFLEQGRAGQRPTPFIGPAFEKVIPPRLERLDRVIDRVLARGGRVG